MTGAERDWLVRANVGFFSATINALADGVLRRATAGTAAGAAGAAVSSCTGGPWRAGGAMQTNLRF